MAINFYYLSGSPFSWRIWLALEYKELTYQLKVVERERGDLISERFLKMNPWGKAPVIEDNGFILYESSAIIEYLEDQYDKSGKSLWPHEIQLRAMARRTLSEIDTQIYPPVRALVEELVMQQGSSPDMERINGSFEKLRVNLNILVESKQGRFLIGDAPGAADFALFPLIEILLRIINNTSHLMPVWSLPPSLRQWQSHVKKISYVGKTIPPHWR